MSQEKAVLAGGCFWGVEDLVRALPGVLDTDVGYTGGPGANPTYESHLGHAEAIEITFDPARISYRTLLEFFFQIHDPTTRNRQGNDVGSSYRSAIFYSSEDQKKVAEDLVSQLTQAKIYQRPIVTEITPATPFYRAEGYHQDYLRKNPGGYTCHYIRDEWKLPS